jgi:hypothetical protein
MYDNILIFIYFSNFLTVNRGRAVSVAWTGWTDDDDDIIARKPELTWRNIGH